MKMSVFLSRFRGDIGFRNHAMAAAQAQHETIFSDLAFLAAVNHWKLQGGGKKKASSIQIAFCIRKRGDKQPNPCAISPVEAGDPSVERLNRSMITNVTSPLSALRSERQEIAKMKSAGGFTKLKGGIRELKLKAGTKGRALDDGLFDEVVDVVTGPDSRLEAFLVGYSGDENAVLRTDTPQVKALEKLLGKATLDIQEMGIY